MNKYIGDGKIIKKSFRDVDTKNGKAQVCQLTVPVNGKYTPGKNGTEGSSQTLWFELTAWGHPGDKWNQAEKWNEKFSEGNYVVFEGDLDYRTYQDKNGDTKINFTIDRANVNFSAGSPRETTTETAPSGDGFFS